MLGTMGWRESRAPGINAFELVSEAGMTRGRSTGTGAIAGFSKFLFEPYFER